MITSKVTPQVTERIPQIKTEIFEHEPTSEYWIGRVACFDTIDYPDVYEGASRLRANVYIDEMHFLGPEHRDDKGCEYDCDDSRSIEFAIVQNEHDVEKARVIATSRLIRKRDENDLLPVERLFSEAFKDGPADVDAVEVSRFISRHEKRSTQHYAALALIRAMTQNAVYSDFKTAYFVIEEPLWRLLERMGLPMEKLTQPKKTAEYGDTKNMAVKIVPKDIIDLVDGDIEDKLPLTKFFKNENGSLGLGFYPASLVRGQ